jgi:hypothetical protein
MGSYEPYRVAHDLTLGEGHGGCLRSVRLAAKDAESAIVAWIGENFNLTPVLGRAHFEQMARYFAEYGSMALRPGEPCYLAVPSGSRRASGLWPVARCE